MELQHLSGKVAVVTGASRGVGKGIALELGAAGATVYVTGRSLREGPLPGTIGATAKEVTSLGGHGIPVRCDHGIDKEVEALFQRVREESGRLDILVNNAFSVPDRFQGKAFWEHDLSVWDQLMHVGCRGHFVSSHFAAPILIQQNSGLIVNISSYAGGQYLMNAAYGVGKAAVDRMAKDMAKDLMPYGVAAVSLWPGLVRTERVLSMRKHGHISFDVSKGESPRFSGRAVVALASDPHLMDKTGQVLIAAELAQHYGFVDIDGHVPGSLIEQVGAA